MSNEIKLVKDLETGMVVKIKGNIFFQVLRGNNEVFFGDYAAIVLQGHYSKIYIHKSELSSKIGELVNATNTPFILEVYNTRGLTANDIYAGINLGAQIWKRDRRFKVEITASSKEEALNKLLEVRLGDYIEEVK